MVAEQRLWWSVDWGKSTQVPAGDRCTGGVRAELSMASRPAGSGKGCHWWAELLLKLTVFSRGLPRDRHKGKLGNRSLAGIETSSAQHRRSHCRLKMSIYFTCWTSIFIKLFWNIQMALLFSEHFCLHCVCPSDLLSGFWAFPSYSALMWSIPPHSGQEAASAWCKVLRHSSSRGFSLILTETVVRHEWRVPKKTDNLFLCPMCSAPGFLTQNFIGE